MWCPKSKKVIQSKDVTFDETAILSSGTDSIVPSIGAGDQEDTSMEIEVETVAAQDGAANQPNREAQVTEPGAINSDQPQVKVAHSTAREFAISCPSSPNWILAMQEKIESLQKNWTWELCKLSKGRRALIAKYIYKKKDGIPEVEDTR